MKADYAYIDDKGNLVLPAELSERYGLMRGSRVKLSGLSDRIILHRPISQLSRVYVEPTTICNLQCKTCMRNVWEETQGSMEMDTFERILDGVRGVSPRPSLFFGGIGEPLSHPEIFEMTRRAKDEGADVELITNGTLLDEHRSLELLESGIDRLWVSIDGATPESYADVRLGSELPRVVENLKTLRMCKFERMNKKPDLGISFVAMKQNIGEIPQVIQLANRVGAKHISISNMLPHTKEQSGDILYSRSMYDSPKGWIEVSMTRMDMTKDTADVLEKLIRGYYGTQLKGLDLLWPSDTCPFFERGSLSVRFDGEVSPCIPLLHSHRSYLEDRERINHSLSFGSVLGRTLMEIWNDAEYVKLRERLLDFDFSPCTLCNSCELADSNGEDCFGNASPACGGCLWAQGFVRCP